MRGSAGLVVGALAALFGAGSAGCGSPGLVLVFPDDASQTEAQLVSIWVLRAGSPNLCAELTTLFSPRSPDDPMLEQDAVTRDVPASEVLAGSGPRLSNVQPGDKVFFAEVKDSAGLPFLRGCVETRLRRTGSDIELPLAYLNPPSPDGGGLDGGDGGSDGGVSDSGSDAGPPLLEITVREALSPLTVISGAEVIVQDGTSTYSGSTDLMGRLVLPVPGIVAPFDVTAVAETSGGMRRAATTLYDISPTFAASDDTAVVNVPLEASDPAMSGTGQINGDVSGVAAGGSAEVLIRTPVLGPFSDTVAAPAGAWGFPGLAFDTYSVAVLVRSSGGNLTFVDAALAASPDSVTPTVTVASFDLTMAAPVNIGSSANITGVPLALDGPRDYAIDLVLPRGPFEIVAVGNPPALVLEDVPDLSDLPAGARLLFRVIDVNAAGNLASEARAEVVTTSPAPNVTLDPPDLPTVTTPADSATVDEMTARGMSLVATLLFGGAVVHVRMEGSTGGVIYRWNLVAPGGRATLPLPALPVGLEVLNQAVLYDLRWSVLTVAGTFDYDTDIASDYTSATAAANVPLRSTHTITFFVN